MFGWFQRLLPKSGDFFSMFERHADACVEAADALAKLTRSQGDAGQWISTIRDREHDADDVIREVLYSVRRTFLTPFDRGAITSLIGAMDDTIDEMQAAASAIELYEIRAFEPEMQAMADKIVEAVGLFSKAMPLLRDIERNGARLHKLTERIVKLEGEVDLIHQAGLKANFQRHRIDGDHIAFIISREIFKHLEKIADAFEDVANQIDALVIDHA